MGREDVIFLRYIDEYNRRRMLNPCVHLNAFFSAQHLRSGFIGVKAPLRLSIVKLHFIVTFLASFQNFSGLLVKTTSTQ